MVSLNSEFCILPITGCIILSAMYVLSLYVWQNTHLRNNPSVIKKRFLSVFITSVLSPFAIYIFSNSDFTMKHSILDLLGLRLPGLFMAMTVPLILTMILFLGPLTMQSHTDNWQLYSEAPEPKVSSAKRSLSSSKCILFPIKFVIGLDDNSKTFKTDSSQNFVSINDYVSTSLEEKSSVTTNDPTIAIHQPTSQSKITSNFEDLIQVTGPSNIDTISTEGETPACKNDAEPMYWIDSWKDLIWLRDHIVAPFSEELTFRACMLPLLIQCFRPQTAVFICPLFFGLAHFHHVIGRVKTGCKLRTAILLSGFQFLFTTMFGAYSAFLFLRTGHFIAPFFAHAFCNHLGFPNFREIYFYEEPKRSITFLLCITGLAAWCYLLSPLTNPSWYKNTIYWKV